MGYDVHITRADDWLNAEETPISLAEWQRCVDDDPDLRLDNRAVGTVGGQPAVVYENDGLAVWTAYSGHDPNGNMAWFDYREGRIVVKNPDDEILEKMKAIAARLGAKVLGDDGESY
jgi:hypothetical protein